MKIIILLLNLFLIVSLLSQPNPTSIDKDSLGHKISFVIVGTNFGVKNPATPLWWDDGEGATHGNRNLRTGELSWVTSTLTGSNKHYHGAWPTILTGVWDSLNIMYRHPIRNVPAPHAHSTRYIAGSHAPQDSCAGGNRARNVLINLTDGVVSNDWFISYYLRLDPLWPTCTNCENNYKFFVWERTPPYGEYQGSGFLYDNWPGCGGVPNPANYATYRRSPSCDAGWVAGIIYWEFDGTTTAMSSQYPTYGYPWITYDTLAVNPKFAWVKSEHIARFSNAHATSIDKHLHDNRAIIDISLDPTHTANIEGTNEVGGITIGGFLRIKMCANGNDVIDRDAWRYFDDVYVDKTFSRVILGDKPTYAACRILEPQIPTTWSNNSITVTSNLGALTDTVAYLYVFDNNNQLNSTGLKVSLGGKIINPLEPPTAPTSLEIKN